MANQSVQMNVRLGKLEKQRGDAALAAMGFSPTQAVRAIWALATSGTSDIDSLRKMLRKGQALSEAGQKQLPAEVSDTLLEEGWSLYAQACAEVCQTGRARHGLSDEELLEQELLERYGEASA